MSIFKLIVNWYMKFGERKKWGDLEKELKGNNDPKEMVRIAINTIEDVLKTRNTTLGKDKNIKGLHTMYMKLTEAKNVKDKIKILAGTKDVGRYSGWNTNLRNIFSQLCQNNQDQDNNNDAKENYETTLEKVNKIKELIDSQNDDDKLKEFVDQIDYFNTIYNDRNVKI